MPHIVLENVGLTFQLRNHRSTLKEFIVKRKYRESDAVRTVCALDGLNLNVQSGGRIGVVGHNGAGKSTLLRLLAGIYMPTTGWRSVEGRISSVFDISLGFEMESTGWENIRYRGYLQGETPKSIGQKLTAIAEFSELGKFLSMPVKYYSSGMLVRLAFSISTAIDPEVLLIDEVLSAGDVGFQQKARQRMREMIARAKLMVLVSHDLGSLSEICENVLWLDHGRTMRFGPAREIIAAYQQHMQVLHPAA